MTRKVSGLVSVLVSCLSDSSGLWLGFRFGFLFLLSGLRYRDDVRAPCVFTRRLLWHLVRSVVQRLFLCLWFFLYVRACFL